MMNPALRSLTKATLSLSRKNLIKGATACNIRRFSSNKELIINAVGSDRCGIVSDLTYSVTHVGGNVGQSQASKLGSYFSLMMQVKVPETEVQNLMDQLQTMNDTHQLSATVHVVEDENASTDAVPIVYSGRFVLEGADNPGIVHKVTSVLAKHSLSIDKLETSDAIAPHGGTTLFHMDGIAHAYAPMAAGFSPDQVREELEALGDSLNCDIELVDMMQEIDHDLHTA